MTPDDVRKATLMTLIEVYVGNRNASRESLCVALDAHRLLTDVPLEDTYKNQQLVDLYPELRWVKTEDEEYFDEISYGKPRPIAIYNRADAIAYYESDEITRTAWNRYAQSEADEFSKDLDQGESVGAYTAVDRDGKLTSWAPPVWFPEWKSAQ